MIEFKYTSGYHGLIQQLNWLLNIISMVALMYFFSYEVFPFRFSNSAFGIIFIFMISIGIVLFVNFKLIKDFPEHLSSYLYVRLHLKAKMSFSEVKKMSFLFEANNGKWYPLEEVKKISKSFRRDFILEFAQMKKEGKVYEKSKSENYTKSNFKNTSNTNDHNNKSNKIDLSPNTEHYLQILNVKSYSNFDEIQKAYRVEIQKYHPDKFEHLGEEFQQVAERKTKLINEAFNYFKSFHYKT